MCGGGAILCHAWFLFVPGVGETPVPTNRIVCVFMQCGDVTPCSVR